MTVDTALGLLLAVLVSAALIGWVFKFGRKE